MQSLWNSIVAWFNSKGGLIHVIALVYAGAIAAYAAVPAFHTLIQTWNAALPGWLEQIVLAAIGVIALYKNPASTSGVLDAARKTGAKVITPMLVAFAASRILFFYLGCALMALAVSVYLTGCAVPTWLTDANAIIGTVLVSASSIAAFLASLSGNSAIAAAINLALPYIQDISNGLNDLDQFVADYNASPSDTTLQKIEAGLSDAIGLVQKFLSDTGIASISPALGAKIAAWAQLVLEQLEAWQATFPALSAKAGTRLTIVIPFSKGEFKNQFNALLNEPTGDPEIDAALKKAKRL